MRPLLTAFIGFGVVLLCTSLATDTRKEEYAGFAYELSTEEYIYKEVHTDVFHNGRHIETTTHYYTPENELFATRTLDFSQSRIAPNFHTSDLRTGCEEAAKKLGEGQVQLSYKESRKDSWHEKVLTIPEPIIIDGGFNQFIKEHWSELMAGKEMTFSFVVPSRLDYFSFHAAKTSENEKTVAIEVAPENKLLSWLVGPVMINYDPDTHRIVTYQGKSNIADEDGKNYRTKLIYPKKGP